MKRLELLTYRPALLGILLGFALAAAACGPSNPYSAYRAAPAAPAATSPAAAPSPAAMNSGLVQSASSAQFGQMLVTADGLTLYTNTFDTPGVSKCTDSSCTSFWLPYLTTAQPMAGQGVTGSLGTLTRPDGSLQVTYNQMPLYTFVGDTHP